MPELKIRRPAARTWRPPTNQEGTIPDDGYYAWMQRSRDYGVASADQVRLRYNEDPVIPEDFLGAAVSNVWTATGPVATVNELGGAVELAASGGIGNNQKLDYGGLQKPFDRTLNPRLRFRLKLTTTTQQVVRVGLYASVLTANFIWFENDPVGSAVNWFGECNDSTATSTADLGVTANTGYKVFEFVVDDAKGLVAFYIDNALKGTVSANVPTAALQPIMYTEAKDLDAHQSRIDYYRLWITRT